MHKPENALVAYGMSLLLIIFAFLGIPLEAEEAKGISSTDLSVTVSSIPEAKLTLTQNYTRPFLQGSHALTQGNTIHSSVSGEISPISLNIGGELTLTPIAFFQLIAGTKIGTGWNIDLGSPIIGIGINRPEENGEKATVDGYAFDGIFWKAHLGGVLQFDLAALFPGDWHHVVFRTYHEANYKLFSHAHGHDAWYYESDFGENQNGFNYYGNALVGYQMPIFLTMVGLLAEVDLYLYDTPEGKLWGDSLPRWYFGALLNFRIAPWLEAALITQLRTMRQYTKETRNYEYYRARRLESPGAMTLEFYRVAAILTFHLR